MKLKRLFWARGKLAGITALVFSCLIISCSSSKIALPIPGQRETAIKNIYIEYLNLADSYYELGKYDKAVSYYKAAMENKDIYWTAAYKLARCYVYQEKWDLAQTGYEDLLKRDPDNKSLQSSLAYIYAMNGNMEKSISLYKTLIEENPDQSEYLENYICLLLAQGKKEDALEQFEILNREHPSSAKLTELAKQFEEAQKESEAETTLSQ